MSDEGEPNGGARSAKRVNDSVVTSAECAGDQIVRGPR
jgi:hypothetical protein